MENQQNKAEKNSENDCNRNEIFGNIFLHDIEGLSVILEMFPEKPDLTELKKEIEKLSMDNLLIYEAKEIMAYCNETNFFHHYLADKSCESEEVYKMIKWFLEKGEEILNYHVSLDGDKLAILCEKLILYSYLSKQPKQNQTKLSYHWQGSTGELTNLYFKMMASKLIGQDTAEADFKAIFEAKPLDTIKPIRWMKTKVLLAYFIHQLSISNSKISASDKHWIIAASCFENMKAKTLKSSNQNWQNYNNPKNHHLIDELF